MFRNACAAAHWCTVGIGWCAAKKMSFVRMILDTIAVSKFKAGNIGDSIKILYMSTNQSPQQ